MGVDSPQKRPGTNFIRESRASDKGSKQKDPLSGEGKSTQTSTNYPFRGERITEDKDGSRNQEGQERRGYVRDERARGGGPVKDATVAADGTNRVKKIG